MQHHNNNNHDVQNGCRCRSQIILDEKELLPLLPLTPPKTSEWDNKSTFNSQSSVSAVLNFITKRQHHQSTHESRQFHPTPLEYKDFWRTLEESPELKGFVENKLRYRKKPYLNFTRSHAAMVTLHDMHSMRDVTLDLDANEGIGLDHITLQPDQQFQHDNSIYPGVIYEVALSQSNKDLRKKAEKYILYSSGGIKVLVGFEIGYHKKDARISVWQATCSEEDGEHLEALSVKTVIDNELFQSPDGSPVNPTKALHLPLDS
ncbi:hypothetical protein DSL72_008191 [Monilinia vaccinii-corymbosi]|uniref:Restriction endonuclease domain-containing protein n=1 Tax=Monilinia vaccinii-corymbosi TaxID=61207 RepID=A0A8A3PJ46_9HELO|nr:hypothetical protein DSL72_008191 [Monilinia vaccinii-corymbosi]